MNEKELENLIKNFIMSGNYKPVCKECNKTD